MIPGITMMNGIVSFSMAANRIPFWPSARLRAASVRWVMNWFKPQ
jgi:hypothetical protein